MHAHHAKRRSQLIAGVSLIAIGTIFYLDQQDIVAVQDVWQYWPLSLVACGLIRIFFAESPRDVSSGCWTAFIGAWLYANFQEWFGMDFGNSWPVLLIGWGIILLLRPLMRSRRASDDDTQEKNHAG